MTRVDLIRPIIRAAVLVVFAMATTVSAAEGVIEGPFTHKNLQVYLVGGEGQLADRAYITLGDAMERKLVEVAETGNVQELTIRNRSEKETVFVHAGDIVKGGKQDRTVRYDLILPPKSGKVPVASFCVESGRWRQRGGENVDAFSMNSAVLPSKSLRIASKHALNQGDVWSGVARQQERLSANVAVMAGESVDVRSSESASSLQLTLESDELEKVMREYLDELGGLLDGREDVIGFVYAINGEIANVEVYNQSALFRALWDKLVRAAITEAIAEYDDDLAFEPLNAQALPSFFSTALAGSTEDMEIWKTTRMRTYTSPDILLFETIDLEANETWIHKNFVPRDNDPVTVPIHRQDLQQLQEPRMQQQRR